MIHDQLLPIKAANEFKDKTTTINQLPISSPQAATAGQWSGSNERRSKHDACITGNAPHNETNQMSKTLS
jgi:hypothetical protein